MVSVYAFGYACEYCLYVCLYVCLYAGYVYAGVGVGGLLLGRDVL